MFSSIHGISKFVATFCFSESTSSLASSSAISCALDTHMLCYPVNEDFVFLCQSVDYLFAKPNHCRLHVTRKLGQVNRVLLPQIFTSRYRESSCIGGKKKLQLKPYDLTPLDFFKNRVDVDKSSKSGELQNQHSSNYGGDIVQ